MKKAVFKTFSVTQRLKGGKMKNLFSHSISYELLNFQEYMNKKEIK